MTESSARTARLEAHWPLSERTGTKLTDTVAGNDLLANQSPERITGPIRGTTALRLNNTALASSRGVLKTDESFSVAAWVRLDSSVAGPKLQMPDGWFAWTAVAQSGIYHSPFYLGARQIEYGGEGTGDFHLHWNFTVAPMDGSDDGPVDWIHAYSSQELFAIEADTWVLLVGIYDLENQTARIHVPTRNDSGSQPLPPDWPKWHGDENIQVGRAWFRNEFVDRWPGSIGPIWLYSGVLTEQDANDLQNFPISAESDR